jgi:hypothetical protein
MKKTHFKEYIKEEILKIIENQAVAPLKTAEVKKIEMLFDQPTLKNALFQINSEQEYKDVIAALHLHFPDAFKKNMSVQVDPVLLRSCDQEVEASQNFVCSFHVTIKKFWG